MTSFIRGAEGEKDGVFSAAEGAEDQAFRGFRLEEGVEPEFYQIGVGALVGELGESCLGGDAADDEERLRPVDAERFGHVGKIRIGGLKSRNDGALGKRITSLSDAGVLP
jgi:hypothetical protein